mmetsp:Transcript_17398/g.21974  ORF Transcript_17398/g.21974 Transcript_17398/m.21974 type:complete len:100 (+) Transcript_17398:1353-1652(+)
MCDTVSATLITYSLIYFTVCQGCEAYSTTCKNYQKRDLKHSMLDQLTDSALGIRHSSTFKNSVVSTENARALSKLSVLSRGGGLGARHLSQANVLEEVN